MPAVLLLCYNHCSQPGLTRLSRRPRGGAFSIYVIKYFLSFNDLIAMSNYFNFFAHLRTRGSDWSVNFEAIKSNKRWFFAQTRNIKTFHFMPLRRRLSGQQGWVWIEGPWVQFLPPQSVFNKNSHFYNLIVISYLRKRMEDGKTKLSYYALICLRIKKFQTDESISCWGDLFHNQSSSFGEPYIEFRSQRRPVLKIDFETRR